MSSLWLVMFACEISLILLCIFETIYAVLLLRAGCVVVHLCDHYYLQGHEIGKRVLKYYSPYYIRYGNFRCASHFTPL